MKLIAEMDITEAKNTFRGLGQESRLPPAFWRTPKKTLKRFRVIFATSEG